MEEEANKYSFLEQVKSSLPFPVPSVGLSGLLEQCLAITFHGAWLPSWGVAKAASKYPALAVKMFQWAEWQRSESWLELFCCLLKFFFGLFEHRYLENWNTLCKTCKEKNYFQKHQSWKDPCVTLGDLRIFSREPKSCPTVWVSFGAGCGSSRSLLVDFGCPWFPKIPDVLALGGKLWDICAAAPLILCIPSFRDKAKMWKKSSRGW